MQNPASERFSMIRRIYITKRLTLTRAVINRFNIKIDRPCIKNAENYGRSSILIILHWHRRYRFLFGPSFGTGVFRTQLVHTYCERGHASIRYFRHVIVVLCIRVSTGLGVHNNEDNGRTRPFIRMWHLSIACREHVKVKKITITKTRHETNVIVSVS